VPSAGGEEQVGQRGRREPRKHTHLCPRAKGVWAPQQEMDWEVPVRQIEPLVAIPGLKDGIAFVLFLMSMWHAAYGRS